MEDQSEIIKSLFYGTHEALACEEADLHTSFRDCKGCSRHSEFIRVTHFCENNLPESYRDRELFEFMKTTSDLTVRVAVPWTSQGRPATWPDEDGRPATWPNVRPATLPDDRPATWPDGRPTTWPDEDGRPGRPFPFYDIRGQCRLRFGSGIVTSVCNFAEKDNMGNCECPKCQRSDKPKKVAGAVWLCTARHVVFDNDEAEKTTCRFFYDSDDSPLVNLNSWSLTWNTKDDRVNLKCVTCDEDLLKKLTQMVQTWHVQWEKVNKKYEKSKASKKMNFIVSHPHGCSKQISVGHWIHRHVDGSNDLRSRTQFTYDTATCPGSSGAFVYSLGYHDIGWLATRHVHCGVKESGLKFSSIAEEWGH